jgi:hypothetical protein
MRRIQKKLALVAVVVEVGTKGVTTPKMPQSPLLDYPSYQFLEPTLQLLGGHGNSVSSNLPTGIIARVELPCQLWK